MHSILSPLFKWGIVIIILIGGIAILQMKRTATYMNYALIAEGLSVSSLLKTSIAQYHAESGAMPNSNRDVGLPAPHEFAKGALTSATIIRKGAIRLSYNKKSGVDNATILLIPNVDKRLGIKSWRCVSDSFSSIKKVSPQCQYVGSSI